MTERDQAFIKFWAKARAKGQTNYIITNTIIFFVLLKLVSGIFNFREVQAGDFSWLFNAQHLGMYAVASVLIVLFRWRRNEKVYKQLTKEE
jgi:hypothetical protein